MRATTTLLLLPFLAAFVCHAAPAPPPIGKVPHIREEWRETQLPGPDKLHSRSPDEGHPRRPAAPQQASSSGVQPDRETVAGDSTIPQQGFSSGNPPQGGGHSRQLAGSPPRPYARVPPAKDWWRSSTMAYWKDVRERQGVDGGPNIPPEWFIRDNPSTPTGPASPPVEKVADAKKWWRPDFLTRWKGGQRADGGPTVPQQESSSGIRLQKGEQPAESAGPARPPFGGVPDASGAWPERRIPQVQIVGSRIGHPRKPAPSQQGSSSGSQPEKERAAAGATSLQQASSFDEDRFPSPPEVGQPASSSDNHLRGEELPGGDAIPQQPSFNGFQTDVRSIPDDSTIPQHGAIDSFQADIPSNPSESPPDKKAIVRRAPQSNSEAASTLATTFGQKMPRGTPTKECSETQEGISTCNKRILMRWKNGDEIVGQVAAQLEANKLNFLDVECEPHRRLYGVRIYNAGQTAPKAWTVVEIMDGTLPFQVRATGKFNIDLLWDRYESEGLYSPIDGDQLPREFQRMNPLDSTAPDIVRDTVGTLWLRTQKRLRI